MNILSQKFEENKKWLIYALIFTFIWGFFAHGYSFVDNNFSHDSLAEFHAQVFGNNLKLGSGRVFVPIYRDWRYYFALVDWCDVPAVAGIGSLYCIAYLPH